MHLDEHRRLPTFETHEAKVETVLSDNGREFCGRPDQHRYELFLQLEEIEHPRRAHQARQPLARLAARRTHAPGVERRQSDRRTRAGCRIMADPMEVWSSFLASPAAQKTAMSPLELDGYLTGIVVTPQAAPILPSAWMARLWATTNRSLSTRRRSIPSSAQ